MTFYGDHHDACATFGAMAGIDYFCIGEETCPDTGRLHQQSHLKFSNPRSCDGVAKEIEKIYGTRFHTEPSVDPIKSVLYCKGLCDGKEPNELVSEWGVPPKTKQDGGSVNAERWAADLAAAKEGRWEDMRPSTYISQFRNVSAIHEKHRKPAENLDWKDGLNNVNWWYQGPSGTGKSTKARATGRSTASKDASVEWLNPYVDEEILIIEDVDPGLCKDKNLQLGYRLKIWGDRYAFPANFKGTPARTIRPKVVIVTSQYSIEQCFPGDDKTVDALKRRFKTEQFYPAPLLGAAAADPIVISDDEDDLLATQSEHEWKSVPTPPEHISVSQREQHCCNSSCMDCGSYDCPICLERCHTDFDHQCRQN